MVTYIIAYYLVIVTLWTRELAFRNSTQKSLLFNLIAGFCEKRFTTINKNNRIRSSGRAEEVKRKTCASN